MSTPTHPPRLYLERVDAEFDPSRDSVLGPWCYTGHEDANPDFTKKTYVDPLADLSELANEGKCVAKLVAYLIRRMRIELNEHHNIEISHVGWYLILSPWLTTAVEMFYLRYSQISRFVEKNADQTFRVVLWEDDLNWQFADAEDFSDRGSYNMAFNWWVRSLILRSIAPPHWQLEPAGSAPGRREIGSLPTRSYLTPETSARRSLFALAKNWVGLLGTLNERWALVPMLLLSKIMPRKAIQRPDPVTRLIDSSYLPASAFPAPFLKVLDGILPQILPQCFMENFQRIRELAGIEKFTPGKIRLGTLDNWNPVERFRAARAQDAGEIVAQLQYGGIFGLLECYPFHANTCFWPMRFLSWGWRTHPDIPGEVMTPVPALELHPLINKHRFKDNTIIFVATYFFLAQHRILTAPMPSEMVRARDRIVTFFNALDLNKVGRLLLRPYRGGDSDLEGCTYILSRTSGVTELQGDLHPALMRCQLLILNHPGTTLNIAMVANVPTICIWNDQEWRLSPTAAPIFKKMRDCGMYFQSVEEAAAFINRKSAEIDIWWQSPAVQEARNEFRQNFAYTRPWLWWIDWFRAFRSLRKSPPLLSAKQQDL